ncbi:MAG: hypothetical protein U0746_10175 [Gemmataceae bacterium]
MIRPELAVSDAAMADITDAILAFVRSGRAAEAPAADLTHFILKVLDRVDDEDREQVAKARVAGRPSCN